MVRKWDNMKEIPAPKTKVGKTQIHIYRKPREQLIPCSYLKTLTKKFTLNFTKSMTLTSKARKWVQMISMKLETKM